MQNINLFLRRLPELVSKATNYYIHFHFSFVSVTNFSKLCAILIQKYFDLFMQLISASHLFYSCLLTLSWMLRYSVEERWTRSLISSSLCFSGQTDNRHLRTQIRWKVKVKVSPVLWSLKVAV